MTTFWYTVKAAESEVTGQVAPLSTTSNKAPSSAAVGFVIVNVAVLTPLYGAAFDKFIPFFLH
ncbi:hypothetical protein D3C80_1565940 [compost metagenome]